MTHHPLGSSELVRWREAEQVRNASEMRRTLRGARKELRRVASLESE